MEYPSPNTSRVSGESFRGSVASSRDSGGGSFRGSVISDVSNSSQRMLIGSERTSNETMTPISVSFGSRSQAVPLDPRISMGGQFKESMRELASDLLIRLNGLGIYGRELQLKQLEEAFERCHSNSEAITKKDDKAASKKKPKRKKQVVWIGGKAGSGKSALVDQFLTDATNKANRKQRPFVAVGKFDLQQAHEPYSGILEACVHLCASFFRDNDDSLLGTLASKLRQEMDESLLGILETYIPNLTRVLDEGSDCEDNAPPQEEAPPRRRSSRISALSDASEELGPMESLHRFQFAFKALLRVVCSIRPLVFVIDDLQWSDDSSLELMKLVLSDSEQLDLLLIGCYREDEVKEDSKLNVDLLRPWNGTLEQVRKEAGAGTVNKKASSQSTAISVRDALKVADVLALLKDFFRAFEEDDLHDLARTIHQRTNGEPFFVTQFLSSLVLEEFFRFSMQTTRWTWDLEEIQTKTRATTNVVELMDQRLRRLPPEASSMLTRLACVGFTIKSSIYELIKREYFFGKADEYLDLCISEGMLERSDSDGGSLRWVHDKILEASLAYASKEDTQRLKFDMGELFLEELDEIQLESELFTVTNLLNEGIESVQIDFLNDERRTAIVELNLKAGTQALEACSFAPAAKYLESGIALLQNDCWVTHYDITLELFSALAEANGYQGKYDLMQRSIDVVLMQKDRPLLDKRRVYNVLLDSLTAQAKFQEGLEEALKILRLLGCKFPAPMAMPFHIISGLLRAKMSARKWLHRDFSTSALMSDPAKRWIMVLLDKLCTCAYLLQSPIVPLVVLKAMDYTRRYGICDYSPVMFAIVGFLLAGPLEDLKTGKLYTDVAMNMVERSGSQIARARTMYISNALVLHWSQPVQSCQKKLFEAYKIGMSIGDQQSTAWAITNYLCVSFSFGVSLRVLYPDVITFRAQMKDFGQIQQYNIIDSLRWGSLALMGTSGSVQSDPDDEERPDDPTTYRMEIYIGAYLGDFEKVIQVVEDHKYMDTALVGTFGSSQQFTCVALSYLSLAKVNKRRRKGYLKKAKSYIKKIKASVEKGCPNDSHFEALLDAEMAAVQGKTATALKHYEIATLLAGRKGQTNDHGLAQRRLGEYYLSIPEHENSRENARYHIAEAIRLNELWGAYAIVDQLNEKHADLLAPVKTILIDGKGDVSESSQVRLGIIPARQCTQVDQSNSTIS